MNLFVGNVDFRISEQDLRQRFEEFGEVVSCKIVTDRETGRSRGFAFVEMASDADGTAAISNLNNAQVGQRDISVSEARPKPDSGGFRGGSGGGGGGGGRGGDDRGGRGGREERGGRRNEW